jgi:hypothetical protein
VDHDSQNLHSVLPIDLYAKMPSWNAAGNQIYYTCSEDGMRFAGVCVLNSPYAADKW